MKRCLITGASGFVGSHLIEYLHSQGYEVFGTIRWRSRQEFIDTIKEKVTLVEADLMDSHSLLRALKEVQPDYIYHLAAQSYVPTSWKVPSKTLMVNAVGQANLFEAVRDAGIDPRIQIACSSEEYGLVLPEETPIKETNPLRPLSPYGVSKVAQDLLGYQYYKSYGMKIVRTRGFNHTGNRRGEVFVTSNFAKQIVEAEKGLREPVVYVGDLTAKRDFTHVKDMVRGYHLALEKGKPGEVYNLCYGKAYSIKETLNILLSMSDTKFEIKEDPDRLRPSDVPLLLGDNSKIFKETGWKPIIPFEQTLKDTLEYWRKRVGQGKEYAF